MSSSAPTLKKKQRRGGGGKKNSSDASSLKGDDDGDVVLSPAMTLWELSFRQPDSALSLLKILAWARNDDDAAETVRQHSQYIDTINGMECTIAQVDLSQPVHVQYRSPFYEHAPESNYGEQTVAAAAAAALRVFCNDGELFVQESPPPSPTTSEEVIAPHVDSGGVIVREFRLFE